MNTPVKQQNKIPVPTWWDVGQGPEKQVSGEQVHGGVLGVGQDAIKTLFSWAPPLYELLCVCVFPFLFSIQKLRFKEGMVIGV